MKKVKRIAALALAAALLLALLTACGSGSLIVGSWTDSTQSMSMSLAKDGTAVVTAYGIPLNVTYEYKDDTLTIIYSEDITETGTVTFFGDNEFVWEKEDSNGELYQDSYTRTA